VGATSVGVSSVGVTSVGVIGLGGIGGGVATNVARAGLELVVCDIRPEATAAFKQTARIAPDPRALAGLVDVAVVAVIDDAQVTEVLSGSSGAFGAARPGTAFIVVSTISSATVNRMAQLAVDSGCELVDCGVSGGPVAAAQGRLVSMVGGSEDAVARVRPVLDCFSSHVVHMGTPGAGLQAKLARNVVQYGSWLAAYEGQRLAEAAGIELSKLAFAIRESDALIGGASRLMFRETVAPFDDDAHPAIVEAMQAGANLAHKDLRAALDLASELGVSLPMTAMTEELCDDVFGLGARPGADT
jgi:3-hydroxyisobutyrate dehydrogenase-like beta-hydroxyacid dehydrogenase